MAYFRGNLIKRNPIFDMRKAEKGLMERLTVTDTRYTSPIVEGERVLDGNPVSCWANVGRKGAQSLLSVTGVAERGCTNPNKAKIGAYYEVLLNEGSNPDGTTDYSYYKVDGLTRDRDGRLTGYGIEFIGLVGNGCEVPARAEIRVEESGEPVRLAADGKVSAEAVARLNHEDLKRITEMFSDYNAPSLRCKLDAVMRARISKEIVEEHNSESIM